MEGTKQTIELIYEYVKDQILSGAYPENERLSERLIGEHFGTSRTVVREAFYELKKSGWLYAESKSGTYVAPIDFEAVKENYEARIYLEPYVLLQAYPKMTEEDLAVMEELCDIIECSGDEQYIVAETLLHSTVVKRTENRYVISFFDTMMEGMQRAASRSKSTSPRRKESIREWRMIVNYLREKNAYMASRMLEKHMINSYHNFLKGYESGEEARVSV